MAKDLQYYKQKLHEATDKIKDLEHRFEDQISTHPIQSISIAFAAGLTTGAILATLLTRKK